MTALTKKRIILTAILAVTTAALVAVYIINGSEQEHLWLYISALAVPAVVIILEIFKKQ